MFMKMRVTAGRIGVLLGKPPACSCVGSEGGSGSPGRAALSAPGPSQPPAPSPGPRVGPQRHGLVAGLSLGAKTTHVCYT